MLGPSHGPCFEEQTAKGKWILKALWELSPALYMLVWFRVLSGLRTRKELVRGFPSPEVSGCCVLIWVGGKGEGDFCDLEYVNAYE